ncbi:putative high-affinity hexose transporter [Leucosporidium creatinivorum]|uniref:Putative high-affinity hexose transporter n=1 Tax=Leucosporidium creatinivorum TaxID=106004 RepID=A0A1Y2EUR4_9BASI|nr:putative high-affinity hexose transporter [Leucosporidium creatinivorum]
MGFSYAAFGCVAAAALSALSLGLDVGMISSTLVQPSFIAYFNEPSPAQIGGIVSAFSAGATVGAFGCAFIADRFGRIQGFFTGAIVVVLGCALQAGAVNVGMLIAGRLITGLGAGQLTAVLPVYASELAPASIRGALGGLQMVGIETAIFLATAIGYAFGTHYTGDIQWRAPLALQMLPVLLLVAVTFFLPESPRWLVQRGREEQAIKVLNRLHRSQGADFVQAEFLEIKAQLDAEKHHEEPSWKEIWTRKSYRKRIFLSCLLQWLAQLTGINCIQYYASTIFSLLGFSTTTSLALNLLYGAFGLLFTLFWVGIIDRLGRRPALIFSSLLAGAALLIQAVLSQVYLTKDVVPVNGLRAQVAMFYIFNLGFVCVGMLAWLIPAEMMPYNIRAKGTSISVANNNIAGIVVAQVSPIALSAISFKFFYVFVAADIVAAVCYFFLFPETSRLTLEQMNQVFGDMEIEPKVKGTEVWIDSVENKSMA